jgi:hypothetical protein
MFAPSIKEKERKLSIMIENYQCKILGPTEIVDYTSAIKQAYPPQAVMSEPFIGFKVLCKDVSGMPAQQRFPQIETSLGFLRGSGCIIRETSMKMPDGFWVISFPVPRSQAMEQLQKLMTVLMTFEKYFGIIRQDLIEINVSGRCSMPETETCFRNVTLPQHYMKACVVPNNSPYRLGTITRINQMFMMFRSRWALKVSSTEDILVIAQLLCGMFH